MGSCPGRGPAAHVLGADEMVVRAVGIADGTIRADINPQDVAVAVLGQLRGIGMQRLLDPDAVDTQPLSRAVAQQWLQALSA